MDTKRVHTLMNSYDGPSFDPIAALRPSDASLWPRQFVFVGRFVSAKNIRGLVDAYQQYRSLTAEPWELKCYGKGPLGHLLVGQEGITDCGFCDPRDLPAKFLEAGALLLPSISEPWGVVIVEALASGMPVLASRSCGATADVIKPFFNGFVHEHDDPSHLADQMLWLTRNPERAVSWVKNTSYSAMPYHPDRWAEQWLGVIKTIISQR